MLKMEINNEEVVCDKELTINQDILATSSVTLKNVYPKSWELTHDYVNNFYFPKDYSKCKIYNEEQIPGQEGETAIGNPLNINYDDTLQNELQTIYGDTFQQSYTGNNIFEKTGDLINAIDQQSQMSKSGSGTECTLTKNSSGTASPRIAFSNTFFEINTTYYISFKIKGNWNLFEFGTWINNTQVTLINNVIPTNEYQLVTCQFTYPSTKYTNDRIYFRNSNTNVSIGQSLTISDFMISKVENYNYEPYVGGTPSPNPNYPQNIEVVTGKIEIVIENEDGTNSQSYEINLGNIELCKIGTYQDYIYKENNKWYIHKEIGKVDDFTNISITYGNIPQGFYMSLDVPLNINNLPLYSTTQTNYNSYDDTWKNNGGEFISRLYPSVTNIYINKVFSSTSDAKNWLHNNGTIIYYPLATPTNTEITDTELINQLNAVSLINGINNISITGVQLNPNIKIYYNYLDPSTETDLIFSGIVKNTGNISLNPRHPHYCSLQILDFKALLSEGETLDIVISNKTIKQAIELVINEIADYGFQLGNIEISKANEIIGAYSTLNKTAYDVFQYLADISQSKWFTRVIDEDNIAIDFYDIENLTEKDDIEYNEEYFEENNIVDITYSYSANDYRNKQIMLSDEVYGGIDFNDEIIADGYNKTFNVSNNIAVLKNVSVNGSPMSIGTMEDKEIGIVADFYYTPGKNTIESEALLSAGSEIELLYIPLVKGRQIILNDDEINRIGSQINRLGVISRYETRNDSLSAEELQSIGETYIKYKGQSEITLKIKTINNDLYNIGDMVYFDAPLDELKTKYMVKKKSINIIATTKDVFYTYELSNTYNSESAINYFDNQRAKANGNISSGEYIVRNIDIENSATIIFDNITTQEISGSGDNLLNSALNSPLNN